MNQSHCTIASYSYVLMLLYIDVTLIIHPVILPMIMYKCIEPHATPPAGGEVINLDVWVAVGSTLAPQQQSVLSGLLLSCLIFLVLSEID